MSRFSLNQTLKLKGFVTQLAGLCGHSTEELARVLGYGSGRLADGYAVLFLADTVGPNDFELRGLTTFPGGVPSGSSSTTHDAKKSSLSKTAADAGRFDAIMAKQASEIFITNGVKRIAKVIPERPGSDYPVGKGIGQWELTKEKSFRVGALVGPGQRLYRRSDGSVYAAERLEPYA